MRQHQPYHPYQTDESQFLDNLGEYISPGRYSFVKRLTFLFLNANSMLLMVILNKNMGSTVARQSASLIAVIWLIILFAISEHTLEQNINAGITDDTISAPWIFYHGVAFVFFSLWRRIGSWWNMRQSGLPGARRRLDNGIGDSVIYPWIRFFLRPIRLIDNERLPKTWLKLNEDRWMQYWQPLLLIVLGYQVNLMGYEVYGNFIMLATCCYFLVTFRAFNNTARMRQAQVDAGIVGDIIRPEEPDDRRHVIGE